VYNVYKFLNNKKVYALRRIPTFEMWLRALINPRNRLNDYTTSDVKAVNFSSTVKLGTDIYYAQGPMTVALDAMREAMPLWYNIAWQTVRPMVRLEKRYIGDFRRFSRLFISNSKFSASLYEAFGVKVDGVIYPPLDTEIFKPTSNKPAEDYVLAYFGVAGKETKADIISKIADMGVKIKAFGMKPILIPHRIMKHRNIEFLGYVSDVELRGLYSNALFTLFPFIHEPFGYIPIESIACGTPVLTYNRQGPSESIVNRVTGWLVNSDEQLVNLAVKLWKKGYPRSMRSKCREKAPLFDVKVITSEWLKLFKDESFAEADE